MAAAGSSPDGAARHDDECVANVLARASTGAAAPGAAGPLPVATRSPRAAATAVRAASSTSTAAFSGRRRRRGLQSNATARWAGAPGTTTVEVVGRDDQGLAMPAPASAWAFRITETGSRWSNSPAPAHVRRESREEVDEPDGGGRDRGDRGHVVQRPEGPKRKRPTVKPEPPPGGVAVVTCEVGPILGDQPCAEQRGDRRRPGSDPPEQRSGDRPRDHKHAQVPFVNAKPEEKDARPETMSLEPQHR